jgi:hypothetical protein
MQALKTNDSDPESFENVIRGNFYYFLNVCVPIDMILIPRRNIARLSFEIHLNVKLKISAGIKAHFFKLSNMSQE